MSGMFNLREMGNNLNNTTAGNNEDTQVRPGGRGKHQVVLMKDAFLFVISTILYMRYAVRESHPINSKQKNLSK